MADNTQIQTAATAPNAGTTPDAKGIPPSTAGTAAATATPARSHDSLAAALDAAFAESGETTETGETQATSSTTDATATTEGEQPADEAGDEAGEQASATTPSDEEIEAAMADDNLDPETPPKGLEGVPKGVWKRVQKQSAAIRDLKAKLAEGAVRIEPTPDNPLSDVGSLAELQERLTDAKATAKELRAKLKENPDGWTERIRGKEVEITPEEVEQSLERIQAEIEAAPDAQTRLMQREQSKPWLAAEALVPGLLEKGTPENQYLQFRLRQVPEIATRIPDFELFIAHAARGARQAWEESNGKAKYVRYELDGDGKIIPPAKPAAGGAKPAAKAGTSTKQPPVTPGAAKPPMTAAGANVKRSTTEVIAALPEWQRNDPEARTRALIEAAEA